MAFLARLFSKTHDRFLVAIGLSTIHRDLSGTVSSVALPHKTTRVYLLNQYKEPEIDLHEALRALRAYSLCERAETIEVSLKCNMKVKKDKIREDFRGTLIFPHTFGNQLKILVFAEETLISSANDAGADIIGGDELIEQIKETGLPQCDVCLSTTVMHNKVKKIQKILRAKMPTEKRGTVIDNIQEAVLHFKRSREFRSQRGYVNVPIGKLDFPDSHVQANLQSLIEAVLTHKNTLPRDSFIQRTVLSSTYGPGFKLITKNLMI